MGVKNHRTKSEINGGGQARVSQWWTQFSKTVKGMQKKPLFWLVCMPSMYHDGILIIAHFARACYCLLACLQLATACHPGFETKTSSTSFVTPTLPLPLT